MQHSGDLPRLTPALFSFLERLERNNRRDWFEMHRAEYEAAVRDPIRALVEEMDVRLARFAPEIVGDPRRSPFRIFRDVRFSRDKTPYKTHVAVWFYHRDAGRGVGQEAGSGAGFYFHVGLDTCFLGGGIWMPPRPVLARLRDALAGDPESFERIVLAPGFRRRFGDLDDEAMLARVPRGFPPDHPAARWLRYRSFTAGRQLTRREVLRRDLPDLLARDFAALLPLVRWLNAALGHRPAARRL
jgi:uncharacterized protein (TIGR02453 family)